VDNDYSRGICNTAYIEVSDNGEGDLMDENSVLRGFGIALAVIIALFLLANLPTFLTAIQTKIVVYIVMGFLIIGVLKFIIDNL
jgi:hypothetical protein